MSMCSSVRKGLSEEPSNGDLFRQTASKSFYGGEAEDVFVTDLLRLYLL